MTDPSTKRTDSILESELGDLAKGAHCYYLKSPAIVEKILHEGRTFYSKFRRYDQEVNPILIRQHLNREVTLALPLLREGRGDLLVVEYFGEEPELFIPILEHLFHHLGITDYRLYRGKHKHRRTVLIQVPEQPLERLHEMGGQISDMLQTRLEKSWKILPDRRLPERYNIFTLPYEYIK
ncbi:DUF1882 domain-containing protein [Nitratifractor salsuginis]|uniref:DUF1882 domain-containing protein n=1 Tax=Nitratifractor salsuginis (strain DSM 16511 / JCM 12458 / E9I37-1) TaxID=749222 RepID=E6X0X3_NITSE|nr:DUF1882 domain-containing protein [Nitratifractor salsuginis]ADV46905.1 Domain of unknown function DUF1882 [Nitratifractor salsuginis DSM 16511]